MPDSVGLTVGNSMVSVGLNAARPEGIGLQARRPGGENAIELALKNTSHRRHSDTCGAVCRGECNCDYPQPPEMTVNPR